MVENP
jgi:diketogulonate reductase-like aldo/keto reductase